MIARAPDPAGRPTEGGTRPGEPASRQRRTRAAALIGLLCAALGFALAVQVRSTNSDAGLAAARQGDLVRILDDLSAREQRLRRELAELERTRDRIAGNNQETVLAEIRERRLALGVLAGTVAARGPAVKVTVHDPDGKVRAEVLLDALEELRGAGAEAVQIGNVRVGASTYLLDREGGGIEVDGTALRPPYEMLAIGDPPTMAAALDIPGGVIDTVSAAGGRAQVEQLDEAEITALRPLDRPQ